MGSCFRKIRLLFNIRNPPSGDSHLTPEERKRRYQVRNASKSKNGMSYMPDLCIEAQLISVRKNPYSIKDINNPSEKVQLKAVYSASQKGWRVHNCILKYIDKPTENVILAAVRSNAENIKYVKDPSPELQLVALKACLHSFRWIDNLTIENQQYVIDVIMKGNRKDIKAQVKDILDKYPGNYRYYREDLRKYFTILNILG